MGKNSRLNEVNYDDRLEKKAYHTWYNMLTRCYNEKWQEKYPTYKGCIVCEEWHNYQVFSKWFYKNYYEIEGHRMDLDKDILIKGNKIYSPETSIFVPHCINALFIKKDANRGQLPIGVNVAPSGKYYSLCSNIHNKKPIRIGLYDNIEEAFYAYKHYKENLIKQIADEYKDEIPKRLYDALYKYEVEITD
ncbi:hypothetical protein AC231_05460 [Clostridium pasteurianum]|nr:hypothetical protein AC231_05460 [Clostridium pasteurianum]